MYSSYVVPRRTGACELEVRCDASSVEVRGAEARPQRQDELETRAGDDARAVDLGVVEDERRHTQLRGQGRVHVEARPPLDQAGVDAGPGAGPRDVVRRVDDHAVPDHAGHAHRHARRLREVAREPGDAVHEPLGRERVGRRDADGGGVGRPRVVEHGGLDATSAAVDGEREVLGGGRLHHSLHTSAR